MFIKSSFCTTFTDHWEKSLANLAYDAINQLLIRSFTELEEIDAIYLANSLEPILTKSYQLDCNVKRLLHTDKSLYTTYHDELAAINALMQVQQAFDSGKYNSVILCAVEKMSDWSDEIIESATSFGFTIEEHLNNFTPASAYALLAQAYCHKYNKDPNTLASVTEFMHQQAATNNEGQFPFLLTKEKILASPVLSTPLHKLQALAPADGACALLLKKEKTVSTDIKITNIAIGEETHPACYKNSPTTSATKKALQQLNESLNNFNFFEIDDSYGIGAVLAIEDLGIVEQGRGLEFFTSQKNIKHINSSGGLKAYGHPLAVTAARQLYTLTKSLDKITKGKGLAHCTARSGQRAGICILEKEMRNQ
ncbi:MAG: thiolase family protein [bacterium]